MKIILALLICLVATTAQAQCVAEIKDVIQDDKRGSIIVEQEYVLNGKIVQQGRTRYLETSEPCSLNNDDSKYYAFDGTDIIECVDYANWTPEEKIIFFAKLDGGVHCVNLVKRIPINRTFLSTEKLKQQKALTTPIITSIKSSLVGHKVTKTEAIDIFKGKQIKVTYDSKNTISNTP